MSTRYFLVIKEINKYLVDMILINYFRSGHALVCYYILMFIYFSLDFVYFYVRAAEQLNI
jgi:hypothetical protein